MKLSEKIMLRKLLEESRKRHRAAAANLCHNAGSDRRRRTDDVRYERMKEEGD